MRTNEMSAPTNRSPSVGPDEETDENIVNTRRREDRSLVGLLLHAARLMPDEQTSREQRGTKSEHAAPVRSWSDPNFPPSTLPPPARPLPPTPRPAHAQPVPLVVVPGPVMMHPLAENERVPSSASAGQNFTDASARDDCVSPLSVNSRNTTITSAHRVSVSPVSTHGQLPTSAHEHPNLASTVADGQNMSTSATEGGPVFQGQNQPSPPPCPGYPPPSPPDDQVNLAFLPQQPAMPPYIQQQQHAARLRPWELPGNEGFPHGSINPADGSWMNHGFECIMAGGRRFMVPIHHLLQYDFWRMLMALERPPHGWVLPAVDADLFGLVMQCLVSPSALDGTEIGLNMVKLIAATAAAMGWGMTREVEKLEETIRRYIVNRVLHYNPFATNSGVLLDHNYFIFRSEELYRSWEILRNLPNLHGCLSPPEICVLYSQSIPFDLWPALTSQFDELFCSLIDAAHEYRDVTAEAQFFHIWQVMFMRTNHLDTHWLSQRPGGLDNFFARVKERAGWAPHQRPSSGPPGDRPPGGPPSVGGSSSRGPLGGRPRGHIYDGNVVRDLPRTRHTRASRYGASSASDTDSDSTIRPQTVIRVSRSAQTEHPLASAGTPPRPTSSGSLNSTTAAQTVPTGSQAATAGPQTDPGGSSSAPNRPRSHNTATVVPSATIAAQTALTASQNAPAVAQSTITTAQPVAQPAMTASQNAPTAGTTPLTRANLDNAAYLAGSSRHNGNNGTTRQFRFW